MPHQYNASAVYDAACHALAIPVRPDLRSIISTSTQHLFSACGLVLSDPHAVALCCALLAKYGASLPLLRRYLSAYAPNSSYSILSASFNVVPPLPVDIPLWSTFDFSSNRSLSSKGAAAILAASLIIPAPLLIDLDIHNCHAISALSLSSWRSFIIAEKKTGGRVADVCGLRLDGCPVRFIGVDTLALLSDVRWISLRYTGFHNLWRFADIITLLPRLTAVLIHGTENSESDMSQLNRIRHFCRTGLCSTFRNMALTAPPTDLSLQSFDSLPNLALQPQISLPTPLKGTDDETVATRFTQHYSDALYTDSPLTNVALWESNTRSNGRNTEDSLSVSLETSRQCEIRICRQFLNQAPIVKYPNYLDFILAIAHGSLKMLNDFSILVMHRKEAMQKLSTKFEDLADPVQAPPKVSITALLRDRELGLSTRFYSSSKVEHSSKDVRRKKRRRTIDCSSRITDIMAAVRAAGLPANKRTGRLSPSTSITVALAAASSASQHPTSLSASLERIQAAALVHPRDATPHNPNTAQPFVPELEHDFGRRARFLRAETRNYRATDFELGMSSALIRRPGAPHVQYLDQMNDKPRQFEYNPSIPSELVYGTDNGYIVVIDQETGEVKGSCLSRGGRGNRPAGQVIRQTSRLEDTVGVRENRDEHIYNAVQAAPVYGLSWLNKRSDMFLSGANDGSIHMYNVNWMKTGERGGCLYTYDSFANLTSLHVNSDDTRFAVSGNQKHVALYDLGTGKRTELIRNCHTQPINVIKFAHKSPHVFVTSSFDRLVKKWDLRESRPGGGRRPIFEAASRADNMMACFSPDDSRLLVSAEDNEVRQYIALDGRLELEFNIPKLRSSINYTRSYYMNDRDYIITGSCRENVVRVYNARTGAIFSEVDMDNREITTGRRLCVQSLRANPHRSFNFSVLLAAEIEGRILHGLIANTDMHRR